MNHLHTLRPRAIHRDLKTENLMTHKVRRCEGLRLWAFADAHEEQALCDGVPGGDVPVAGPEVMVPGASRANEKSDVYSFGLILF